MNRYKLNLGITVEVDAYTDDDATQVVEDWFNDFGDVEFTRLEVKSIEEMGYDAAK